MLNILEPQKCRQRTLGGFLSYYTVTTVVSERIFLQFLCPYGTLGGWKVYQPSRLFLANVLVCYTCRQGAWEGDPSHFSNKMVVSEQTIFMIFASRWYSRWYKSLSTFLIFHGDRFGMPYLPPGGLGRSSQSFFRHDGGVGANHFYDFRKFLRPNGTLGGWNVSQPS